jgi:hypothetical protein
MRRLVTIAALLLLALPAQAEFVNSYGTWSKLTPAEQSAFVAGAFDASIIPQNEPDDLAYSYGIVACANAIDLSAAMLVDAVSNYYINNTEVWDVPAVVVLHNLLHKTCLYYINSERAKYALPAWE